MFTAINKITKERVNAWAVFKNPTYLEIENNAWLANPDDIREDYDRIIKENKDVEFRVHYVKEKNCVSCNGKEFITPACFHFYPGFKEKYNINFKPESKEHKLVKNWIFENFIHNENIVLKYSDITKPYRYSHTIKLNELPINYNECSIEPDIKDSLSKHIRIDVLLPFYIKHPLFGNGIAFEIQFSPQKEKIEDRRTLERIYNGFSVIWLHEDDFNLIDDEYINLKSNNVMIQPFMSILKYSSGKHIKNLKIAVERLSTQIDYKKIELIESFEKQIDKIIQAKILNIEKDIESKLYLKISEICKREFVLYEHSVKQNTLNKCPKCNTLMKYIKEGVSKKNGKHYDSFYVCDSCKYSYFEKRR